jgi:hypothetical protein
MFLIRVRTSLYRIQLKECSDFRNHNHEYCNSAIRNYVFILNITNTVTARTQCFGVGWYDSIHRRSSLIRINTNSLCKSLV